MFFLLPHRALLSFGPLDSFSEDYMRHSRNSSITLFNFLIAAESRDADLRRGSATPLLICGSCWCPVVICRTPQRVSLRWFSHGNFTQDMTSPATSAQLPRVCTTTATTALHLSSSQLPVLIYRYPALLPKAQEAVSFTVLIKSFLKGTCYDIPSKQIFFWIGLFVR